jgi:tetratricopeptide (TPR) repeat protein
MLLDSVSNEALENFPAQPYFYYARGLALNKKNKFREAVSILEASLDYMLDDIPLANKIYKELYEAYTGLNNPEKANVYLRKVNPGF